MPQEISKVDVFFKGKFYATVAVYWTPIDLSIWKNPGRLFLFKKTIQLNDCWDIYR